MMRDGQRGVTLLETLVALVILSLAVGAALGMLNTTKSLYAGAQRRQQLVEVAIAESFIRDQIEGIAPAVKESINGVPVIDFSGTRHEIRFIASSLVAAELPTLQQTRIIIENGELILYRAPVRQPEAVQRRVLASYPLAIEFRFGETAEGDGVRYVEAWVDKSKLPDIVLLTTEGGLTGDSSLLAIAAPALSARY
jgi:prepilin-type N-terminal cleavage/methylation domain-containing protein